VWFVGNGVSHPLYWREQQDGWMEYHLTGLLPLQRELPVSHVSYYEADAFARWYGARLPDEFELENFLQRHASGPSEYPGWLPGAPLHPVSAAERTDHTMLWQWTASAYSAYPGYVPERGALGEYNSKFMCNQYVLRGGCFATPPGHLRHSYRNFYRAFDRWAFTGIRLARMVA
jgi:formylglycine-generating enzyme required for sulfatase activity